MIRSRILKCPLCSDEVFELIKTGTPLYDRTNKQYYKNICKACFEDLINEGLAPDKCPKCESDFIVPKTENYYIKYHRRTVKTFYECMHCAECEHEFMTNHQISMDIYRIKVLKREINNKVV